MNSTAVSNMRQEKLQSLSYQPTTCASPHLACEADPTVFDFDLDNFAAKGASQDSNRTARPTSSVSLIFFRLQSDRVFRVAI